MNPIKPLTAALVVGGVLVSTAGAFSLRPGWFKDDDQKVAAASNAPVAPSTAAAPAPSTTAGPACLTMAR